MGVRRVHRTNRPSDLTDVAPDPSGAIVASDQLGVCTTDETTIDRLRLHPIQMSLASAAGHLFVVEAHAVDRLVAQHPSPAADGDHRRRPEGASNRHQQAVAARRRLARPRTSRRLITCSPIGDRSSTARLRFLSRYTRGLGCVDPREQDQRCSCRQTIRITGFACRAL